MMPNKYEKKYKEFRKLLKEREELREALKELPLVPTHYQKRGGPLESQFKYVDDRIGELGRDFWEKGWNKSWWRNQYRPKTRNEIRRYLKKEIDDIPTVSYKKLIKR